FSIDGFPFNYPWRYRLLGRLVSLVSWRWLVSLALRPGFRSPPSAKAVEPDAVIAPGDGVKYLLQQISRIEKDERMTQPSPVEGRITHEQWCYFHLRHAQMPGVVGSRIRVTSLDGSSHVAAGGDHDSKRILCRHVPRRRLPREATRRERAACLC